MDTFMFDFLTSGNKERLLMTESWAEGVETIVTNDRYRGLDINYIASNGINAPNRRGWNDNRQVGLTFEMDEYTPLVIDLIDNLNQNQVFLNGGPIDRVTGYSLQQIQSALNNSRNLEEWENKLRWNFDNPMENRLEELFEYVNQVRENL